MFGRLRLADMDSKYIMGRIMLNGYTLKNKVVLTINHHCSKYYSRLFAFLNSVETSLKDTCIKRFLFNIELFT